MGGIADYSGSLVLQVTSALLFSGAVLLFECENFIGLGLGVVWPWTWEPIWQVFVIIVPIMLQKCPLPMSSHTGGLSSCWNYGRQHFMGPCIMRCSSLLMSLRASGMQLPIKEACHVAVQRSPPGKQRLWKHTMARQLATGRGLTPVVCIVCSHLFTPNSMEVT